MEKEIFLPLLNTEFRVLVEGFDPLPLKLVEVSDLERISGREIRRGKRGFSLLFGSSRAFFLPQSIYRFEHEALGIFELFIVPVHPDDDQTYAYEAIFNFV
ncbi:MAG: hypothetical protein WCD76_03405 [Pyrinomonadaceae bacterium]